MKIKSCFAVILLFLIYSGPTMAQTGTTKIVGAASLKPYGRYLLDQKHNLELISSAVHFGFTFTGKECAVYAFINDGDGHNYLQYELDGIYQKRLRVNGNTAQPISITASADGQHTVWIYKATEATTGPVIIQKIIGNDLHILDNTNAPLIEFIGHSITCGAAADTSDVGCGKGVYHDQHNAYGPRVARALNLNYMLSSVSGIGIYRTWNMDSPSMPQVYERESFNVNDSLLWNFKSYTPRIVSIALGTNDLSNGDGIHPRQPFDSAVFVKDYIAFVQLVKSKYPAAIVALLSSPMINGDKRTLLQNCLTAVKQNIDALFPADRPVALYFFHPMNAHGCSGHPSVEDHAVLAQELIPFFRLLLN